MNIADGQKGLSNRAARALVSGYSGVRGRRVGYRKGEAESDEGEGEVEAEVHSGCKGGGEC